MNPTTRPTGPEAAPSPGFSHGRGALTSLLTFVPRLALHFWTAADPPVYDTNARAREVLLGYDKERAA